MDIWHRFEDHLCAAPIDEFDNVCGKSGVSIVRHEYKVVRHTPKGVWLELPYGAGLRFVLKDARKRFACPTVEDAFASFCARKNKQIRIYKARIENAEEALYQAEIYLKRHSKQPQITK